jgi:polyphosphate kinase
VEVWLASADWMGRNLFRRIEVAFPVLDPELKARVVNEGLKPYLTDNCDAWELSEDGEYERLKPSRRSRPRCAQQSLVDRLGGRPEADTH